MPQHPRTRRRCGIESLEPRTLLTVTVNAGQVVREVNPQVLGVNLAWWDSSLTTARTRQMVQDAGLNFFRFPGGSSSDEFHFNDPPSYNGRGTAATFANFVASVGGDAVVTLNYGTGSPQEAAAWLAYLNAAPSDATPIGTGQQWNATTSQWVQKDWKTAGYWAGLRAAAPLAQNDGLNFLRVNRAAPFGFHYFEIGNEIYGSWEVDHHGQGGDAGAPHDPATYAAFAKRFADYANQIDPTIAVGVDSGAVENQSGWLARVLRAGNALGFVPDFVSDHVYMQGPGNESDTYLLLHTVTDPATQNAADPHHWGRRATGYRNIINATLGAAASGVELLATEFNSVYADPGKQTTSLVNGLFTADSIGGLLQTEYDGANFWDLRNGWATGNNNSASLYGWRQGGDYGLLGSGAGPLPSTGTYVPYPTYFAEQIASKLLGAGGQVVGARTDNAALSAYAVRQPDGGVNLLVINKNPTTDLSQQVQLEGFTPEAVAHVWRYGKAEDTAQSQTADGHASLTSFNATVAASFGYTFPSYSMTVIELDPRPATVAGRYVFYNNSALDGGDPAPGAADDAAIDGDKAALLPGRAATFDNVTGYVRGINGVMIDVAGLPADLLPSAEDFDLSTGDGTNWSSAPGPNVIAVRRGAGAGGSDRVTLTFADGAVANTWLRVTVLPTARTGLAAPDVFSFGNLIGETGGVAATMTVNAVDLGQVRAKQLSTAPADLARLDFNKDGRINAIDLGISRANQLRSLPAIGAPAATTTIVLAPAPGSTWLRREAGATDLLA